MSVTGQTERLPKVTRSDIEQLLQNGTREGRNLDYKRDLKLTVDKDKRELARDVASLANSDGGFLVFGVDAAEGIPTALLGVPCPNEDDLRLGVENILRDNIQPRVQGISIGVIHGFPNGAVVVVHAPRSWNGPHMAATTNSSHFFSRNSAGKFPLDVQQIRSAFLADAESARRIQAFRDDRIGRALAGKGAMPLLDDGPILLVHVHPMGDAPEVFGSLAGKWDLLPPHKQPRGVDGRFSIDGFVTTPTISETGQVYCYTMVFRNGAFERCEPLAVGAKEREVYGGQIEAEIYDAVHTFVRLARRGGESRPLVAMATLCKVNSFRIWSGDHRAEFRRNRHTIDRDIITLPDLLIDAPEVTPQILRPTFDALWQSGGLPNSPYFDSSGNWAPPR